MDVCVSVRARVSECVRACECVCVWGGESVCEREREN